MLIAVSGNIGSGKTTLANYLASQFDLHYVPSPSRRLELNFLDEFFKNVEQNFLPAQLSFLISKSIEIQELEQQDKDIVLDRSILEDIDVFARLWIEQREIDPKIVELYHQSAEFVQRVLPKPDLYLFCRCRPEISRQRIALRPKRSFEDAYPPNHIEMLAEYYDDFLNAIDAPCVEIDTELFDFTSTETLDALCTSLFERIRNGSSYGQMSFFEDTLQNVSDNQGILLRNFNDIGSALLRGPGKRSAGYIYLAAPFTEMAPAGNDLPPESNEENLLSGIKSDADYGILPKEYQKLLKRIEKVLAAQCQMDVHLPHRDINNWGKTKHSSKELTPAILHAVSGAAALVAIPGNSIGVHLELGVAIAQKKPIIIFDVDELPSSFFVAGFSDLPFVKYIPVKTLSQIPKRIKASDLSGFIARMR